MLDCRDKLLRNGRNAGANDRARAGTISTYCLTYEEDTEFFLRHARGEFRQDSDSDAEFFETAMSMLEAAGYEHYEISNYARPGFASAHNRGYWSGADYLGIGPSAFSTVGLERWQNVCDYPRLCRSRTFAANLPIGSTETSNAGDEAGGEESRSACERDDGVPSGCSIQFDSESANS